MFLRAGAQLREVKTITDTITTDVAGFAAATDISKDDQATLQEDQISISELTRWFLNLFPCRFGSVIRREGNHKWLEISRFHNLSDEEIMEAVQNRAKLQRGYRFEASTRFLVLHIPASSQYQNPESVSRLRRDLEALHVKPRHYQFDEDWYLHIYLKNGGPSAEFARHLQNWCRSAGYEVDPASLRIHPDEEPLPFPLQAGFTWLNERCQLLVRRDELSFEDALFFFLQDAGKNAVEPDDLLDGFKQLEQEHIQNNPFAVPLENFSPAFALEEAEIQKASEPADSDIGNVIEMKNRRLGDDLLFACETLTTQPQTTAETTPQVRTNGGTPDPEPEIERQGAVDESQLLLFRAPKTGGTEEASESNQTRKRRTDRRARQQQDQSSNSRPPESVLPSTLPPEE